MISALSTLQQTKSWTKLKKLLRKRARHGSIYVNGVLYVLGGCISFNQYYSKSDSVDCLVDETWQCGPNVPIAVEYPQVANINDKVYLLDRESNKLLQLSTDINVWNRCASYSGYSVATASMISVNDQLFLVGGFQRICAWYTPSTDTWCMSHAPEQVHYNGALVHNDNTILLLGGWDCRCKDAGVECSENGTWSVSNIKMPQSLQCHHAFVLNIPHED